MIAVLLPNSPAIILKLRVASSRSVQCSNRAAAVNSRIVVLLNNVLIVLIGWCRARVILLLCSRSPAQGNAVTEPLLCSLAGVVRESYFFCCRAVQPRAMQYNRAVTVDSRIVAQQPSQSHTSFVLAQSSPGQCSNRDDTVDSRIVAQQPSQSAQSSSCCSFNCWI